MPVADDRIVTFFARVSSRLRARHDVPVTVSDQAGERPVEQPARKPEADAQDAESARDASEDAYEILDVDAGAITSDLANRLAMLDQAELVAAGRDVAAVSGRALLVELKTRSSAVWIAGPQGRALERPVGWVTLSGRAGDPDEEASGPAMLHGSVAAEHRANGLGRTLLSRALARAAELGHRAVAASVWEASEAEEFLWRHGFSERLAPSTVRRIDLLATAERRRRIAEDALSYGACYQLLHERAEAAGTTTFRVRARHLINGLAAGCAELTVAEAAPEHAVSGDVRVETAHRGHRLGLLMLSDLLHWIEIDRPGVRIAQSAVPVGATHASAIVDRLGSRIAGVQVELRRTLR